MRAFLGTVLSVIAVGVLLIAYGLLSPRGAADAYASQLARPMPASDVVSLGQPGPSRFDASDGYNAYDPYYARRVPAGYVAPVSDVRAVRASQISAPVRRTAATTTVERANGRDWRKTALIIGGSTAGAAGIGAIFGGKKGALIGAAIGGGASTIYEATKR